MRKRKHNGIKKIKEEKMKKLLSMGVAFLMALGLAGCGNEKVTPPEYHSDERYEIGMWVGVSDQYVEYDENGKKVSSRPMTDEEFLEEYREIAESGINIAFPGYGEMGNGGAYNAKALKAAHEVGIKQIIADDSLRSKLNQAKTVVDSGAMTEEELVADVKAIVEKYTETEYGDALYGFMIKDEPGAELFDTYSYGEKIFKQAAPDLMFYVNLFPVIADGAQLSGVHGSPITYDAYLTQWLSKVQTDYISYDHYPLFGDGVNTSVTPDFLYNMDIMQTKLREEGRDRRLWTFLQSIQFGGKNRPLASKADASFQAYSFLAYGGDGIQWFCYACPPENDGATFFGNNALVDRNYDKTATYDYVQSTNRDIQALMPYYKNFEWKGVMLSNVYDDTGNFSYLESSENVLTGNKTLKKFESTEDAFTGVFEDKDGRQGFLVVNFTDPAKKAQNTVTMTLDGATHAIVVKNGESTVEKVQGGKLTLNMKEGEGYFVIPFAN